MTYRERREARAERLRGWAEKRYAGAEAVSKMAEQYRGDVAFNTQPGRIPERERLNAAQERSWESVKKAESMDSRATTIERQLDHAIYSDDPDAIERLAERVAELEAERDTKKAANARIRKTLRGVPDEQWPAKLAEIGESAAINSMWRPGCGMWAATYSLTNLTADIARNRQRLEQLRRQVAA